MGRLEVPLDHVPFAIEDEPPGDQARPVSIGNARRLADWLEAELERLRNGTP